MPPLYIATCLLINANTSTGHRMCSLDVETSSEDYVACSLDVETGSEDYVACSLDVETGSEDYVVCSLDVETGSEDYVAFDQCRCFLGLLIEDWVADDACCVAHISQCLVQSLYAAHDDSFLDTRQLHDLSKALKHSHVCCERDVAFGVITGSHVSERDVALGVIT